MAFRYKDIRVKTQHKLANQRKSIPVSKGRTNYVAVENQFSLLILKQRIGRMTNVWNWVDIKRSL